MALSFAIAIFADIRPASTETTAQNPLDSYLATIDEDQPYREPTEEESQRFLADFRKLLKGKTNNLKYLPDLGYEVHSLRDPVSEKEYILAKNRPNTERAWGAFLIPVHEPINYVISAPHPQADIDTEHIALELWRKTDNAMLMVAGAHRDAADELADVAREEGSLFHHVSELLAQQSVGHVQIHGYADSTSEGNDVIISSGESNVYPVMRDIANKIESTGLSVGTNWDNETDVLLARHNVQGRVAYDHSSLFMHVEINYSTRQSAEDTESILRIIADKL